MNANLPSEWVEHDRKIRPYLWNHRILSWANKGVSLALFLWLLFAGQFSRLSGAFEQRFENTLTVWLAFFLAVGVLWEILGFPFSLAHYRIERRYHLSKQSLRSWFWDKVKGWWLAAVLGAMSLAIVFFSVTNFGQSWWWFCATLFVFFSIILAQLTPVLLIPLFFKLKPMEQGALKQRLLDLCRRFQVEVSDVYHLGLGEKTEKGNAAFVGLGRTKRILIGDTLYEKYPPEQVEAVFAHELGHQVHNDLWKGIGFSTIFLYFGFWAAHTLCQTFVFRWFGTSMESPLGVFLFFMTFGIVQAPIGWLQMAYSRSREYAADRFAADKIGVGKDLALALENLTRQNYSLYRPHPILEFFTYSHPAPWRRILGLR